jgi:hypothetical protein
MYIPARFARHRRLLALLIVAYAMLPPHSRAQMSAREIAGDYEGRYACSSSHYEVHFKLSLAAADDQNLTGTFTFEAQNDSGSQTAAFSLKGTSTGASFTLNPVKWETPVPPQHMLTAKSGDFNVNSMIGMLGFYESPGKINGVETGLAVKPSCRFSASRSKTATAQSASRPPASATSTPSITPQELDPRVAQIPEPFRQRALDEVPATKAYCEKHTLLTGLFDCDCFSKMVLRHRIAHAKEYYSAPGNPQATGGWTPFPGLIIIGQEFKCSECISDDRITKWASSQAVKGLPAAATEADKKLFGECVAKNFLTTFRANPYLVWEKGLYNKSLEDCRKQLNP